MRIDLRKRTILSPLLFVPAVILSACSHQLARSQAADLIKADPVWSKPITTTAKIGGIASALSDVSFEKKLQSLGYVEVQDDPHGYGYYQYIVRMTPKGDEAIRTHGWTLASAGAKSFFGGPPPPPIPQTLTIPLGTLHLLDVTGVVGDDKEATAEFTWQLDCHETVNELGCTPEKKPGKRHFTRYDDGWRLDPIK